MTQNQKLQHIAIIMDGNGRWAQQQGLDRVIGHQKGVLVAEDIITHARNSHIPYLTLYAFSKENWDRPKNEVNALMNLLEEFLLSKKKKMLDNEISFSTIGNISLLPESIQKIIHQTKLETSVGKKMTLTLALSYGSRDEILRAIQKMIHQEEKNISEEIFHQYLDTAHLPDPDLIIRTSNEFRTSNFLQWQAAYAEYYFEPCLWPDFTPKHFDNAIKDFQKRNRRFGKL